MDGLKCTKDASARFDIADNLKIILFVFHGFIGKHNNFKSVRKKHEQRFILFKMYDFPYF